MSFLSVEFFRILTLLSITGPVVPSSDQNWHLILSYSFSVRTNKKFSAIYARYHSIHIAGSSDNNNLKSL
jgi:hypothetical protein